LIGVFAGGFYLNAGIISPNLSPPQILKNSPKNEKLKII
jgi:hypothetical protein